MTSVSDIILPADQVPDLPPRPKIIVCGSHGFMQPGEEYYLRYDDYCDESTTYRLDCWAYRVVRRTAKMVVLDVYGIERRVLESPGGKRFAYATREDALRSYYARKQRQVRILRAKLAFAEEGLANVKAMLANDWLDWDIDKVDKAIIENATKQPQPISPPPVL